MKAFNLMVQSLLLVGLIHVIPSCFKPEIHKGERIEFRHGGEHIICGKYCGTLISIEGEKGLFKLEQTLPQEISSGSEYWNKVYKADVQYLKENCSCIPLWATGPDLKPGVSVSSIGKNEYPLICLSNIKAI